LKTNVQSKVVKTGPDRINRFDRLDREPDLHPVRVDHKTGLRMNRSLNRKIGRKSEKTGSSKSEPV
jgi:hypothetical protein